jgi:hypothetical protein
MCVCGSETSFKIAALELILTQPKNAILQQYRRLFEMEEIDLTVADDALCAIARKAIDNGNSAWALRTIMEELLLDTMFHLPALKGQLTSTRLFRAGEWNIVSRRIFSMTVRNPHAPVPSLMALWAMAVRASSATTRLIDCISNSRWYCVSSAFLGWVRMSLRERFVKAFQYRNCR